LSRGWGASGRAEAALEVVHQREQTDTLEGAVAAPNAGLSKNASLLQPLERAQHSRFGSASDPDGPAEVDYGV
jgi:hypothetical protein